MTKSKLSVFLAAAAISLLVAGCDNSSTPKSAGGAPAASVPANAIYDTVASKAAGFTVGNMMAARVVYVMFDPQCPHCGHLWQTSKPLLSQIRMVWCPIRFSGDISVRQGAVLLSAQDPAKEMEAHERSLEAKQGGLTPPADIPAEMMNKVKANTELMSQIGADEVPFIVYKDPRTGQSASFKGALETEDLRKLLIGS